MSSNVERKTSVSFPKGLPEMGTEAEARAGRSASLVVRHTTGPWDVRRSSFAGEIRAANKHGEPFIAQCVATNGKYAEAEANARLIAAAPDLLELAKEYLQTCWENWHSHMSQEQFDSDPVVARIRSIIAQATAQQERL